MALCVNDMRGWSFYTPNLTRASRWKRTVSATNVLLVIKYQTQTLLVRGHKRGTRYKSKANYGHGSKFRYVFSSVTNSGIEVLRWVLHRRGE